MSTQQQAQHIARVFHETYEFLAPDFGYETRDDSAVPWEQVPPANRALMVATVQALLDAGVIKSRAETIAEVVEWHRAFHRRTGVYPATETFEAMFGASS